MKKVFSCIIVLSLLASCGNKKSGNMVVNGNISGLKKGTVYLQKFQDTVFVSVDSIKLNGESHFTLTDNVKDPEMYFIALDKIKNERISFFGEKGDITVNSKLEKFSTSVKVSGSKNQLLLEEHDAMAKKFRGRQLEIIKEKFEASKANDNELALKIEKEERNLIKRKFYYTVNFAVNNADREVAPYLALTQLNYAHLKLLDTVNNSLSKKVKNSKYGLELDKFIKKIKSVE